MKTTLASTMCICGLVVLAGPEPSFHPTNDVPISAGGIRLIITDEEPMSIQRMAQDIEVRACSPLLWALHNTSSNENGVVFLGITNTFSVSMRTTDGVPLQKTLMGRSMGAEPQSLGNLHRNKSVKRLRLSPAGGTQINDFPTLTELFHFPSNGIYHFEVRYWAWSPASRQFKLSTPVSLRVVKD
jgi:hypothetical protein